MILPPFDIHRTMAKVKIFNAAALRTELIKLTGWDFTFRHKYTGDTIGVIQSWPCGPKDEKSPFAWPTWQVRSKWSTAQNNAFQDKLKKEKERITIICVQLVQDWMAAYHPELVVSVRAKDEVLFIEAVNASTFGIVQALVVAKPDNAEELSNLLRQI